MLIGPYGVVKGEWVLFGVLFFGFRGVEKGVDEFSQLN